MKQNDEHQHEGGKNVVGVSPLCLGRLIVALFLSISLVVVSLVPRLHLTCIGLSTRVLGHVDQLHVHC